MKPFQPELCVRCGGLNARDSYPRMEDYICTPCHVIIDKAPTKHVATIRLGR